MRNKTEQRGFIWLSVLLIAVLVVLLFIPYKSRPLHVDEEVEQAAGLMSVKRHGGAYSPRTVSRHYEKPLDSRYAAENNDMTSRNTVFANPSFEKNTRGNHELIVELNSADTLDLQDIYGIGSYFSRAIVKYRNLLGGYVSKEQLLEVYGMTSDRYKAIEPQIRLDSVKIRKLKINTASYAELRRHPYIDNHLAKAIIRLRGSGEQFRNARDLYKISIIDKETIQKLTPYLDFETSANPANPISHNDTIPLHSGPDGPNA